MECHETWKSPTNSIISIQLQSVSFQNVSNICSGDKRKTQFACGFIIKTPRFPYSNTNPNKIQTMDVEIFFNVMLMDVMYVSHSLFSLTYLPLIHRFLLYAI